jgi:LysM repeat protein
MRIVLLLVAVIFISVLPVFAVAQTIPEGFVEYEVKKGDTLGKIAPCEQHDLILRVNRIDKRHLLVGKKILIPDDFEKASQFLPVPRFIEEMKDEQRSICVFLDIQYFGAYENGELSFWGPISSGKKSSGTPTGKFSVIWKAEKYRSKKYDAEMPFAVNISSDGYFLHEQSLPGRPASHGCIRLLREDAEKIYVWIQKNDPIIISSNNSSQKELFFLLI